MGLRFNHVLIHPSVWIHVCLLILFQYTALPDFLPFLGAMVMVCLVTVLILKVMGYCGEN